MKKLSYWLLAGIFIFSGVFAQEQQLNDLNKEDVVSDTALTEVEDAKITEILPVINVPEFVKVNQKILFDSSESEFLDTAEFEEPTVSWDFGGSFEIRNSKQVVHEFENVGKYNIQLTITQGENKKAMEKTIFVYSKKGVLITDKQDMSQGLVDQAKETGTWLKVIENKENSVIGSDESLVSEFQKNQEIIKNSEIIIFDTDDTREAQSFAQWWKKLSEEDKFDPKEKAWVQISDEDFLDKTVRLVYPTFSILNSDTFFVIRNNAAAVFFEDHSINELMDKLDGRGLEYILLDDSLGKSWFQPISKLINYFIFRGISQDIVYLLLAVPFIAFLIAFFRQFVGIKTFGIYSPLMLSLSFMLLGLKFGFVVFLVVLFISFLLRLLFKKVELLYIPKIALLHSGIALSFIAVLGVLVYFNANVNLALVIFPMMVMSTISEKFVSTQSEGGMKLALITAGETVLVSLLAYLLVMWQSLQSIVLTTPEWIFLPILGLVWLGKFTGLRLTEYFKFRSLFDDESSE